MRFFTILTSLLSFTAYGQTNLVQEDFSNGIPSSFILINDGKTVDPSVSEYTSAWITLENYDETHEAVASSTSYFTPSGQRADRWMIVPNVDLSSFGSFVSWEMKGQDISFLENIKVLISTTGTNTEDFTDTLFVDALIDTNWRTNQFNLSELGYLNQTVHLAFVNQTVDGFKIHLDNISIITESDLAISKAQIGTFSVINPFNEILKVETEEKVVRMQLFDSMGKLVKTSSSKEITTSELNTGVYMLNIQSDKGYFTTRVVKH